jgi:DNA primase
MFPIWSDRGKVIGFGGRALGDAQPKYLNSPESPLYSKSYVLYALHLAREAAQKAGRLVVVEGYFDCLSLHQNGIENVVASCGTSLTGQQVALMSRYVPEVVMNYDPDVAGQNAIRRSIDLLLEKALRVRILRLPGALDPDDFIRKEGREVYQRLLDAAPYFWQYLITDAAKRFDLEDPSLKAAAVRDVMDHVVKIQDQVERLEVGRAVAEGFKLPETVILDRLNLRARRPEPKKVTRTDAPKASRRLLEAEKQLIQALGQDEKVSELLQPLVKDEFWKEAWSWPVLERLIQNPRSIEAALDGLQDQELAREVRAAVMEPVGLLTVQHAFASVERLYDAHLVKKEKEIRVQLEQFGSGGAPPDLWRQYRELRVERHRVAETFESLKTRQ